MFKWCCLAIAVVFLGLFAWMVNDIRFEVRRSAEIVQTSGKSINEHLPTIVERSRKTTDTLAKNLPDIVEKVQQSTNALAELAEDIRQLKELAGVTSTARDKNLVAYADSVLKAIEASGGSIGLKKLLGGKGLKDTMPAKEWAVGARKEALLLTVLAHSKKELATRLAKNKFGSSWYIQLGDKEPVTLMDWLKAHHPESMDL